jgi:hypothetical protein
LYNIENGTIKVECSLEDKFFYTFGLLIAGPIAKSCFQFQKMQIVTHVKVLIGLMSSLKKCDS